MEQRCQVVLFSSAGKKCFGPGPAELLERVERSGSLHQAAKQMYLSYSKAFKLIRAAEEGLGFPLMETRIGGARGGGSILTPLAQYRAYEAAVHAAAEELFPRFFPGNHSPAADSPPS